MSPQAAVPRRVAAFDFDGTLAERDSLLPFLQRLCGTRAVIQALAGLAPGLARAMARGDDEERDAAKATLFARLLAGRSMSDLEPVARAYAEWVVARRLRPDMLERVEWHRSQGHELVMVSASPELYLSPVGRLLGFDAVLGTRLEVDGEGRLTGRLEGRNVRGAEKVARLRAHLADSEVELWAYGDSSGDRELLALAQTATRVTRRRLPGWARGRRPGGGPGGAGDRPPSTP